MPAWPHGTATGKVPFRVVTIFIEYQITDACEMAQFNVATGYTGCLPFNKPHLMACFTVCFIPHKEKEIFLPKVKEAFSISYGSSGSFCATDYELHSSTQM